MALMLSTPAYTEEMAQRGQFSREVPVPDMSLFNPQAPFGGDRIASPYSTEYVGTSEDAPAIEAFMRANGITDIVQGRKAYFSSQQQPQPGMMAPPTPSWVNEKTTIANPFSMIPVGEQYNTIAGPLPGQPQTTPDQQLNTPSFEQLAQPNPALTPTDYAMPAPPPSVTPVPVTQPSPDTSNLIQQIQAPVAGLPPTPATMPGIPVSQPSPGATNLIQQIQAPTTPRPVTQPNQATQQFAQQFRPQPAAQPRPQPAAQQKLSPSKTGLQSFASMVSPGAAPVAQAQPRPQPAPKPTPKPTLRTVPVAKPQPAMRPAPVLQPKLTPQPTRPGLQVFPSVVSPRPMARSVSRVNPPLLPTRPMGRR